MTSFLKRNNNGLLLLLVALNLGMLALLLWPKPPLPQGPEGGPNPRMHHLFREKLNLSSEQATAFEAAMQKHRAVSIPELQKVRAMKQDLIRSMAGEHPDTDKTTQLIQKIAQQHAAIDSLLVIHYQELKAICTPEQQVELETIFMKSFDRRNGRRKSKKR